MNVRKLYEYYSIIFIILYTRLINIYLSSAAAKCPTRESAGSI